MVLCVLLGKAGNSEKFKMRYITLDFETYYSKEFSLSKMTTEAYIRDQQFEVIGFSYKINQEPAKWVTGSNGKIAMALEELDIPNSYLICHNMAFDGAILAWRFGIIPKYYLDTLSMSRPITGLTVGGSLKALADKYGIGQKGTEVINALGKRRSDFEPGDLAKYGDYCNNDVELTWTLFNILKKDNPPKELYIQDLMMRMFTDPVLKLDRDVLITHLNSVQDKKAKLMERIDLSIGRDALMSNPQFAEVLKKLGVEPPMKISLRTNKEAYAFSKTDYEFKALLEHPNTAVQAVVAARLGIKSTLEETRTESFLGISERGALPILLNYWGAHTGRASGGDKMNLQNLPRGGALRRSIRVPDNHVLVAVDSAQIEARVVAWLAGQEDLLVDFRNSVDIYSKFASIVYGKPVTKADKVERFVGKTCILGLGYGMGPDKFQGTLKIGQGGISVAMETDEAKQTVTTYRTKYAMIAQIWKDAQKALEKMAQGFETTFGVGIELQCSPEGIHLPNGTMVRYPNLRKSGDGYEYDGRYGAVKIYGGKVVENVVQALARIVVFDQMAKIDMEMRKNDNPAADCRYKVALTVHDEVVAVVPKAAAQWALEFMTSTMSVPPKWCADLPVSCEGDIGENYADAK
jgi:DNA polymerase I-like protein with 3'-5' exonuclease and polymerase domains